MDQRRIQHRFALGPKLVLVVVAWEGDMSCTVVVVERCRSVVMDMPRPGNGPDMAEIGIVDSRSLVAGIAEVDSMTCLCRDLFR